MAQTRRRRTGSVARRVNMPGPLSQYQRKRDFATSPEPRAARTGRVSRAGRAHFVVHLHHARSRHFDLRLQVGDVLRSWAVPKGPSLDPRKRRQPQWLLIKAHDEAERPGDEADDTPLSAWRPRAPQRPRGARPTRIPAARTRGRASG